ncbi:NnrU family protein [Solimicrobium silvestre]|uniref:Putative membrane protein n=1 Tax=Solimicrobium silvestre TaxID=2099400 RepID=A0A2S9H0J9_9BURK|nr:NnrU family protein [Solimicrobium silvestre]PRC93497.1 putative membrane protein [Solimicrobium silvestre]
MLILVSGLFLFFGVHSIRLFADGWRARQIERIGAMPWKGIYSVVSIIGFGLIIWGFGLARSTPIILWVPPTWTRHLTAGLMLISFLLLVATYVPGNRIKAIIGHPMLLAVKVWAAAHLLANGTLADTILFGAFLIWSITNFAVSRRRDRLSGVIYPVIGIWRDLMVICIGLIAFVLFAHFGHVWLIGVNPFG